MKSVSFKTLSITIWHFLCFSLLSQGQDLTAYVFIAEECPISIQMTQALKESADKFGEEIKFIAVFPNRKSNYKTMVLFLREYGLDQFESILDSDQAIARKYGATITPEVIIVNNLQEILYRGQISDAYHKVGRRKHGKIQNLLTASIAKILDGFEVDRPWPKAIGCYITFHSN